MNVNGEIKESRTFLETGTRSDALSRFDPKK